MRRTCTNALAESSRSLPWSITLDPALTERGLNTLADLGDRHVIYALCDPCKRSTRLSTPASSPYMALTCPAIFGPAAIPE